MGMKFDVQFQMFFPFKEHFFNSITQPNQLFFFFFRCLHTRQCCDFRFKHQPDFKKLKCQFILVIQHICQSQRILFQSTGTNYKSSQASAYFQNAFRCQAFHSFPHRSSAHSKHFCQCKFIRYLFPHLNRFTQNIIHQFFFHLCGQKSFVDFL